MNGISLMEMGLRMVSQEALGLLAGVSIYKLRTLSPTFFLIAWPEFMRFLYLVKVKGS